MAEIVRIPGNARSIVTLVDSPASIKLVQRELLTARRTYTDIAKAAGLANSTVSNIASGNTRWPRIETIIRILGSLGWRITASKVAS